VAEPLEDDDGDITEGGSRVYRHREAKDFELASGDEATIAAVEEHLAEYAPGSEMSVFHELISDKVHLDVHLAPATKKRPFHVLMTSGMSGRKMKVPKGEDSPKYAELCVFLPADWKLTEKAFKNEDNYWPVRWLKQVARLPFDFDTFLAHGHTIPNGDPPEPFADNTEFCCVLLKKPDLLPKGFRRFAVGEKTVQVYCMVPLYPDEVTLKLKKGTDALLERFAEEDVSDEIDIGRPSVAKKKGWWPFG
jgi:hypothetical protein